MLRKLLLVSCIILASNVLVFAQSGTLKGKLTDKDKKEPIPFATVVVETGGKQVGGANTDIDGNYTIKPLTPGKYNVKASFVGYKQLMITDIVIKSDNITFQDFKLETSLTKLNEVVVEGYKVPLIEKDGGSSGGTATKDQIAKMPGRSAESVAVTVGGVFSKDGEMGSVRGSRSEGTVTYIDGVRVRSGSSIPQSAIEQVTVITGGLPAQYGDATGGVVNITTKGPSRQFGGGVEILTSQFLDKFGYNLVGFSLQGPLLKGKDSTKSTSLLGYFISGELSYQKDPTPYQNGTWKVNDNLLSQLEKEPLRPSGTGSGAFLNSEFLRNDGTQLENISSKENGAAQGINLSGKIDVRTTPNTNLTFGGSFDYNLGRSWSYRNSLLNSKNNQAYTSNTWRVFGRFTQRFPGDKDSKSLIKNVYYSIQADYSKSGSEVGDKNQKDNLFNYGYLGKFTTHKAKYYEYGADLSTGQTGWLLKNNYDVGVDFERSEINPELANYTSQYYEMYAGNPNYTLNQSNIQLNNGILNGDDLKEVYGMWYNTGTVINQYYKTDNTQIALNLNASADIKNHGIQFGFRYEERDERQIVYSPVGLWYLMRTEANKHIEQLDFSNPHFVNDATGAYQDTINYDRLFDAGSQSFFDKNLRNKLGLDPSGVEWIDVDSYAPETFSINMFSADELLNSGKSYVSYYGYDHTGKKLSSQPSFDDFFTAKDENGNFKREIGAYKPIYMAGYITDKFAFKDLIFNIGIRLDRFDANQKVLKDPFLLYDAKTVKEVDNLGVHPQNMGQDYVVYVNDVNNPTSVVGYRDGYNWYNAEGTQIQDPSLLETGGSIKPYLLNPDQENVNSSAFKDYVPQTTLMPRISFSFPISDEALFFAHYDVLSSRPVNVARLDPTDYYFIENVNTTINNPDLKPEKTVDYEVGFQQKLSNSSSVKFSAYYRELRDQVQVYKYFDAYPRSYTAYNNIDFGTVKGATLTYDLRRTGNVWLKANYTLQFADGTGSDATSAQALVNSGQPNLRTTNPFTYDQRHAIQLVLDYRFDGGSDYNGPTIKRKVKGTDKIKTIPILQNTGINFTFGGGSGTPYTKTTKVVPVATTGGASGIQGSINGSRLPWQFRIDARLDRDITVRVGKKAIDLNVYFQVLNVLNTQNIISVYGATGNPDDDGYLAAAEYQNLIQQQTSEASFRDLYAISINRPGNYSLPRRIRFGVSVSL